MDTNVLLIVLIGVLVLMAGIQAFQLNTLSQIVSSGSISTSGSTQQSALSQLPSQVGGCG